MLYLVTITSCANEAGKKLNPEIRRAAKAAMRELALSPFIGKELQAQLSGFWSFRFLRYRIIYKVDMQRKIIIVWAVGHRRDIYETLNEHKARI